MQAIGEFINRQDWPDEVKREAHAVVDMRATRKLNPLTGSAWFSWAEAHGVTITFQQAAEVLPVVRD